MGDDGKDATPQRRSKNWIRKVVIASAVLFVVFVLFHGPILRPIVRKIAIHSAAKENLKLDFQIDGSVLGGIILRNIHATATGPSAVESIDADFARADYSLWGLLLHGLPDFLQDVELRSASIVLTPDKAPPPRVPKPHKKIRLPAIFPEEVHLSNITLVIRDQPQDFVLRNLNLELDPRREGRFEIERLQIPNVHAWSHVSGTTSYTNRNLFVRSLVLDEQTKFQVVNIDASRIHSKALGLTINGEVSGGAIQGSASLQEKRSSLATEVNFSANGLSLGKLMEYFGHPADFIAGNIDSLKIAGRGILKNPKTWDGSVTARIRNVQQKELAVDQIEIEITAANAAATIKRAIVTAGNNRVELNGTATLPNTVDDFGRTPADVRLLVHAPDLKQLTGFLSPPVTGSADASGSFQIKEQTMLLKLSARGNEIGFGEAAAKDVTVNMGASKKMPASKSEEPYYRNLVSSIHAELSDVHYDQYVVDSVSAEIGGHDKDVSVRRIMLTRNANEFTAEGKYELPLLSADPLKQPGNLDFTLNVTQLADFWQTDSPDKIAGMLQGDGQLRFQNGTGKGQLKIFGQNITAKNLLVRQLTTQASMNGSTIYLNDLTAALSEKDSVKASGTFSLQKPNHYSGKLIADIADLAVFKPVLKAAHNQNELAGSLQINWQGSGDARAFTNSGVLKLVLEKGRYGDLRSLQANVDANYSPDGLNVPIIFLGSDRMDFQAIAQTTGQTLEISKIQIDQGKAKYATGYFSFPFIWKNLGSDRELFPANGKVNVTFQSENLDLRKLFEDFGAKAPVSGTANVKLDAQGTLADLRAQLDLQMRDLRAQTLPSFEPATFDIGAHVENRQLVVSGKLQQAKIQPLQIDANMPFDPIRVLEKGHIDDNTPITAKVRLPRSSVNFLRQFVPIVQEIDGDLALDMNVNGTIANPVLSGAGDMTINVMRFTNPTLPAVRDFKTRLDFNRDTLSFSRFAGELAGGPFTVSGRITFPKADAAEYRSAG